MTTGRPKQWSTPPAIAIDTKKKYEATITTSKGVMIAELFVKDAPKTVNNFVFLAKEQYYNGVKFHRIIKGFMVQTGDPLGNGTGGPGYKFADEPVTKPYTAGTLAMANAGPNTNGSQFFIMHSDYALPPNYTIFGKLLAGQDTLNSIANTAVTAGPGGERSTPAETITITSITIAES